MKTPVQELKDYLLEYSESCFDEEQFLINEKEFARKCFEAGADWSADREYFDTHLPFDEWYKQFEQ